MVNSYQAAAVKELKKAKELARLHEQETLIAQQKQKARAHDARMKEIAAKEARIASGEKTPLAAKETASPAVTEAKKSEPAKKVSRKKPGKKQTKKMTEKR
ncbi:MAG TPA: hypothetical protein DCW74_13615 [Alteromonas australica]|uniref:Uncharacterized protein n=1 Tax=Alteromonas australica TaxID=589873 RepID=A0A350P643_9ALTE|nr:hypothetical protein [Alteromonas australica]|tara:strand:- start:2476 stop:2778 length:303 start_codon:yes stop_codon:yes gene_type:complete